MKQTLCMLVCLSLVILPVEARGQDNSVKTEEIGLQRSSATGTIRLTLDEAVRTALENNPALKVEKIRVQQARSRIDGQKGEFNPLFNAGSKASHQDNIVASRFYPTGFYAETQKAENLGIETKNHFGGRLTFALNYADLRSSSNTQTLSPQHSANLSLGFSQALLRDFGRSVVETRLRIAEKGADIAEGNLFTRTAQMIQRVEETYWNLTFLLKNLEGKQRSLESAREFLAQNENLLRAGRVAPVSVSQARAAVAEREGDVITAQTSAEQYEDRLKNLLWLDLNATDVTPIDPPEQPPADLDVRKSMDAALQRRPELRALQRELEQRDLEVNFAENQKKPRLDLNAQYSVAGLSGKPNATCLDPTSVVCIPVGANVSGSILDGRTGRRDSLTSLVSANPFDSWFVELKLQIPLGNQTAKAQHLEATLKRLETGTNLAALRDQISIEIRDAIREAQAAQKRIDSAREVITYVGDQLDGMRRQLEAGLVSSYDVLKAFEEVDKARTTELQAMMDLHVALSRVRLAEASGFEKYKIELADAPQYTFGQAIPIR